MQNQLSAKANEVINELREEGGYTNQEIKAAMSDGEICGYHELDQETAEEIYNSL